jgi:hypothetical protein
MALSSIASRVEGQTDGGSTSSASILQRPVCCRMPVSEGSVRVTQRDLMPRHSSCADYVNWRGLAILARQRDGGIGIPESSRTRFFYSYELHLDEGDESPRIRCHSGSL